ncbi:hypothetical protein L1987_06289 [Smallanthus sonchifolius]|uniref:Uncharacterized protein n=1 Tax=Smallanthus sonchifolius TaxID=185202 RepID=A0ACB9JXR8_9ASTR|nr:hypothetical protein L1987_06289 [Smallanthus sonchifolius]
MFVGWLWLIRSSGQSLKDFGVVYPRLRIGHSRLSKESLNLRRVFVNHGLSGADLAALRPDALTCSPPRSRGDSVAGRAGGMLAYYRGLLDSSSESESSCLRGITVWYPEKSVELADIASIST